MSTNLSENSINALEELTEQVEFSRFRKNLRSMFFEYLRARHYDLLPDFEHFIEDMNFFFDFLEDLETKDNSRDEKGI